MERNSVIKLDKRLFTIIYLDRHKLEISTGTFQSKNELPFPQTLVLDCEVIDTAQFVSLITKFIDDIKLQASSFIVVLSPNVVFSKSFPLNASTEDVEGMQAFLANVPFENILTHVYRGEKDQTVIVANKEFVESVQQAFEQKGFVMEASSPAYIFGQNTGLETGLTEVNAKLITTKRDFARSHSFKSSASNEPTTSLQEKKSPTKEKEKKRQEILIGIFVLLFLVLIAVIFVTRPTNTPNNKRAARSKPVIHPTLSPTLAPVFAVTNTGTDSAQTQSPAIQILSSGNSTDVQIVQSLLSRNGYTDVTVVPNASPSSQFELYLSPTVAPDIQSSLTQILTTAFPTLTVKNQSFQALPVTFILGK